MTVIRNSGDGLHPEMEETLVPVWQAGTVGGEGMIFSTILDVDFDTEGNIYALDYRDQRITVLTPDGEPVRTIGERGQGPGELSQSRSLSVDGSDIFVANEGNGRLEHFKVDGQAREPITLQAVTRPGYVFTIDDQHFVGRRFVPDGHFLYRYGEDWDSPEGIKPAAEIREDLDYLRSHHIVCPADDGFWIIYMLRDEVEKINFQGETVLRMSRDLDWDFPKDQNGRVVPEILVHRDCAVDPEGNLYLIYSNPSDWKRGNDVYKFGSDGRLHGKAFTLPIHRASALDFDADGNLYYSDGITLYKARLETASAG